MRHRVAGRKLSRSMDHRKALFRNLIAALLEHERIETTEARAKAVRPEMEKLITLAKRARADESHALHARRQALRKVQNKELVAKLFDELADDYFDRPGGYTRIVKLGPRKGDAAPMVILELVG